MTKITERDEELGDLEWYALDTNGLIAHFMTGGRGQIPRSVAASMEDLDELCALMIAQEPVPDAAIIETDWRKRVSFNSYGELKYVGNLRKVVQRGYFAFDCMMTGPNAAGYFMLASPGKARHVDEVPPRAAEILVRTTLRHTTFAEVTEIMPDLLQ